MIGDQLLEVNGKSLVGVSSDRLDTQVYVKLNFALEVLHIFLQPENIQFQHLINVLHFIFQLYLQY